MLTFRQTPITNEWKDRLAKELIDWAVNNKKALILNQFFGQKGISTDAVHRWRKNYPAFDEACRFAIQQIGMRREVGSLTRKFDGPTFFKTAYKYSPDFKVTAEWQQDLKQKSDEKTQQSNIQWVLEKFPHSNVVPKKKKDADE